MNLATFISDECQIALEHVDLAAESIDGREVFVQLSGCMVSGIPMPIPLRGESSARFLDRLSEDHRFGRIGPYFIHYARIAVVRFEDDGIGLTFIGGTRLRICDVDIDEFRRSWNEFRSA